MIITWEVEDGYIGKGRPQKTKIPNEELEQFETEEEKQRYIEDCVQEDFEREISWSIIDQDDED